MGGIMTGWATGNYEAAGYIAPLMYFIGVAAVLVSAIILKKTKPFSGEAAPFVMELPAYHIPSAKTVLMHTGERLWGFIKKAGDVYKRQRQHPASGEGTGCVRSHPLPPGTGDRSFPEIR